MAVICSAVLNIGPLFLPATRCTFRHKGARCEPGISEMWQKHQDCGWICWVLLKLSHRDWPTDYRNRRIPFSGLLDCNICHFKCWSVAMFKGHVIGIHQTGAVWALRVLRFGSEGLQQRFSLRHSQGMAKSAFFLHGRLQRRDRA